MKQSTYKGYISINDEEIINTLDNFRLWLVKFSHVNFENPFPTHFLIDILNKYRDFNIVIRGLYKPHEYGEVILPMTVIKRFHDTLLPTREKSLRKLRNVNFRPSKMDSYAGH